MTACLEVPRERLAMMARVHPTAWAIYASRYAGDGTWENARHFDLLADRVLRMVKEADRIRAGGPPSNEPGAQRLSVSLPPGSGKSEFLSFSVASWLKATRPRDRVVIASYAKDLALGWSERARDTLAALGPEVFGIGVNSRQKAQQWEIRDLETGKPYLPGYFYAVGRGGGFTGKRAEWLILDDLIKDDKEASSASVREAAWRWKDKVAMTRLLPHSCVIEIATRWHHDDPIGRQEVKNRRGEVERPWEFLNLPALALDEDDLLGRSPGETLWPSMWSQEHMEAVRRGRDPRTWSALYQGRPTPDEGSLFRSEWVRDYRQEGGRLVSGNLSVERSRLKVFSTVDLAGSRKQRADWTVIATWGIDHASKTLWLLDVVRKRLEAPAIIDAMLGVRSRLQPLAFYCEKTGPQLNLVHALRLAKEAGEAFDPDEAAKEHDVLLTRAVEHGLPIRKLDPVGDKVTRSAQAQAVMHAGRLMVPASAPWRTGYLAELLQFPEGKHDDQVDVTSSGARVFLETLAATAELERRSARQSGSPLAGRIGVDA